MARIVYILCALQEQKAIPEGRALRMRQKLVFAKLAKHNLRNNAKQCKSLFAKVAKVAKAELHCKTRIQITKHCKQHCYNSTFTAGRESMSRQPP